MVPALRGLDPMSLSGQGPRSPASCTEQLGYEFLLQSAKGYARGRDLATSGILKAHAIFQAQPV